LDIHLHGKDIGRIGIHLDGLNVDTVSRIGFAPVVEVLRQGHNGQKGTERNHNELFHSDELFGLIIKFALQK
jgi:hypothetical protein